MRHLRLVAAGLVTLVTARSASGRTTAEFDRQIGAELRARDPASAAPENRAFLAVVLSAKEKLSRDERNEANELARAVGREARDDAPLQHSVAQVALRTGDLALLSSAVDRLKVLAPHEYQTLRLEAVLQLNRGHFREAKGILLESRAAGLPEEDFRRMSEAFDHARPWSWKALEIGGVALGFAAAILLLAFVAGSIRQRRSGRTTPDPDAVS